MYFFKYTVIQHAEFLSRLAKPTFRSRYAHTPFRSAPVPILSSKKLITNFVMRSKEVVSFVRLLIGQAK